jgi:hypothetical protein
MRSVVTTSVWIQLAACSARWSLYLTFTHAARESCAVQTGSPSMPYVATSDAEVRSRSRLTRRLLTKLHLATQPIRALTVDTGLFAVSSTLSVQSEASTRMVSCCASGLDDPHWRCDHKCPSRCRDQGEPAVLSSVAGDDRSVAAWWLTLSDMRALALLHLPSPVHFHLENLSIGPVFGDTVKFF